MVQTLSQIIWNDKFNVTSLLCIMIVMINTYSTPITYNIILHNISQYFNISTVDKKKEIYTCHCCIVSLVCRIQR